MEDFSDSHIFEQYLNEGQNPSLIRRIFPIACQLTMGYRGEGITAIFHQHGVLLPAFIIYTPERVFTYRPTLYGALVTNYWIVTMANFTIKEGPIWTTVAWGGRLMRELPHTGLQPGHTSLEWAPHPRYFNFLPREQGLRLYTMCRERETFWNEEWRTRIYEWNRSKSGTLVLKDGAPNIIKNIAYDPYKFKDPEPTTPGGPTQDDIAEASELLTPEGIGDYLRKVKSMYEEGKITEADYKAEKANALSQL